MIRKFRNKEGFWFIFYDSELSNDSQVNMLKNIFGMNDNIDYDIPNGKEIYNGNINLMNKDSITYYAVQKLISMYNLKQQNIKIIKT